MENVRVLVIDDEPSRTLFASILDADGWRIEPGARAEQALELLRQGPWHLVLANLAMTRLDGPPFALLKELAEADGPPQVLFLLPAVSEERLRHSLKQLNLAYTTKPIRLYDLLQQISDMLLDAGTISQPLRRVRELAQQSRHAAQPPSAMPGHEMFPSREAHYDYTEEELRQFEEEEEQRRKQPEGRWEWLPW